MSKLSRREMLKVSGALAAGSMITVAARSMPQAAKGTAYDVVWPLGKVPKSTATNKRLDTLNGKTVCMVWNYGFQGNVTMPAIADFLKKKYPTVNIVPYTEFFNLRGESQEQVAALAKLPDMLKAKKCDAVITGNGG